MALNSIYNQ